MRGSEKRKTPAGTRGSSPVGGLGAKPLDAYDIFSKWCIFTSAIGVFDNICSKKNIQHFQGRRGQVPPCPCLLAPMSLFSICITLSLESGINFLNLLLRFFPLLSPLFSSSFPALSSAFPPSVFHSILKTYLFHILTIDWLLSHRTDVTGSVHFPEYLLIDFYSHTCVVGYCILLSLFRHFFFEHRRRWSTNGTQLNFAASSEVSQPIRPQRYGLQSGLTSRLFPAKCRIKLNFVISCTCLL